MHVSEFSWYASHVIEFLAGAWFGSALQRSRARKRAQKEKEELEFKRRLEIAKTRRVSVARPDTTPARVSRAEINRNATDMRADTESEF